LKLLDCEEIGDDDQLMDVGLDSFGTMELSTLLADLFQVRLLPTLVFTYPTVYAIAIHVCSLLGVVTDVAESMATSRQLGLSSSAVHGVEELGEDNLHRYATHQDGDVANGRNEFSSYFSKSEPR
jgi:acyl carrier protein